MAGSQAKLLSDDEVFGSSALLSDDDVFGVRQPLPPGVTPTPAGRGRTGDDPRRLDVQPPAPGEPIDYGAVAPDSVVSAPRAVAKEDAGIGGELGRLRDTFFSGVDQTIAGGHMLGTTAQVAELRKVKDKLAAVEAAGEGDSEAARGLRMTIGHYERRLPSMIAGTAEAQAQAQRGAEMVSTPAMKALQGAKTFTDAWEAFKQAPYEVISGITAQSLPAMLPALVAGAVAGPATGIAAMGLSSGAVEAGSALADYARERGVDVTDQKQLEQFFGDPAVMTEAMRYAGARAGIIGAVDAASAGVASKVLSPPLRSQIGRQVVNVPAQMGAQAAAGAGGEAGAQIATKGRIDQPGQVLAEAIGEFGSAPGEVLALGRQARQQGVLADASTPVAMPAPVAPQGPAAMPAPSIATPPVPPPVVPSEMPTRPMTPAEIEAVAGPQAPKIGVQGVPQGTIAQAAEQELAQREAADRQVAQAQQQAMVDAPPALEQSSGIEAPKLSERPFRTVSEAAGFAYNEGLASRVQPVEVTGGVVLRPVQQPITTEETARQTQALADLRTGFILTGATNTASAVSLAPQPEPGSNLGAFAEVAAAVMGRRPIFVKGLGYAGVAQMGNVFIDPATEGMGKDAKAIAVTWHEATHALEQGAPDLYKAYASVVRESLKPDVVMQRQAKESGATSRRNQVTGDAAAAPSRRAAEQEIEADIGGGFALQPAFWKRMYDLDNGSTARRLMYQFMRAATRFIRVARGSRYDPSSFIEDVEKVREAYAQAMSQKAKRGDVVVKEPGAPVPKGSSDVRRVLKGLGVSGVALESDVDELRNEQKRTREAIDRITKKVRPSSDIDERERRRRAGEMPAEQTFEDERALNELGAFDIDRMMVETVTDEDYGALAKQDEEESPVMARIRRERHDARQAKLKEEARESDQKAALVSDADIEKAGLYAESAFPKITYLDEPERDHNMLIYEGATNIRGRRSQSVIVEAEMSDGETRFANIPLSRPGSYGADLGFFNQPAARARARASVELSNQNAWAAQFLEGRRFDLVTAVNPRARGNLIRGWRGISQIPGALRFERVQKVDGKTLVEKVQSIADQVLAGSKESARVFEGKYGMLAIEISSAGRPPAVGEIGINDAHAGPSGLWMDFHTIKLTKGSSLGAVFYQIAQEAAFHLGYGTRADDMGLSAVNTTRRTEQMLSAALRNPISGRFAPGVGQRIYGWNHKTTDARQIDLNMARLALAQMRNVGEVVPEFKRGEFTYDLAAGTFSRAGVPADEKINEILRRPEVRDWSISRSSLARAAISQQLLDGKKITAERAKTDVLFHQDIDDDVPAVTRLQPGRLAGRDVSYTVQVEDTGQTATITVDGERALLDLQEREDTMRRVKECLG
jgi:hypothetical protein